MLNIRTLLRASGASLLFSMALLSTALAQAPVCASAALTIVVPAAPGGSSDALARFFAPRLSAALGQTVVVSNKPGASSVVGISSVAKAPGNGCTLLLSATALIQLPSVRTDLPYDAETELAPVALLATTPLALAVPKSTSIESVDAFLAKYRNGPGAYGSNGNATSSHVYGELFNLKQNLRMTHVPYKSMTAAAMGLMGGEIDGLFIDPGGLPKDSGRLRLLAVTGSQRIKSWDSLPTFKELGYAGYEAEGWFGFLYPKSTNRAAVDRVATEVRKITQTEDFAKQAEFMGLARVTTGGSSQFEQFLVTQKSAWASMIKEARVVATD